METDREKFPVESKLWDTLCVVRAGAEGGEPQLARVSYFEADVEDGPERLEAEFAIPKKPKGLGEVTKHVYLHLPDGEIRYEGRRLPREAPQLVEVPLRRIRYTDIAAVWMRIIHRPSG